jgi:hypothetical protein
MNDDVLLHGEQLLHALHQKDCERARANMASAPLTLTDHDFVVLHNYGDEGEDARAYEARRQAQLAIVAQHTQPMETKREALLRKHGHKPVTWKQLTTVMDKDAETLVTFLKDMNQKNIERNQRLDALENRVLELEAALAARDEARHVDH